MIWGVGTGRCGTTGLAIQLGGLHEQKADVEELIALKDKDVRSVTDPAFWRVLPILLEEDPDAKFVWIYREPMAVVRSWLSVGLYDDLDPVPLAWDVEPPGGWPEDWQPYKKGAWLWRTINGRILEQVVHNFEVRHVSELDTHVNKSVPGRVHNGATMKKVKLTKAENQEIYDYCEPLWTYLKRLNEETRGATGAWGHVSEVTEVD